MVLAARDERQDPGPRPIPVVHDLPVTEPKHHVSAGDELEVARAILVERGSGVERPPVELDDEPLANEEIDASDP